MAEPEQEQAPKPRSAIRRFDVFAEYSRLKALDEEHLPPDEAKGYGIWLAKIVAARRGARSLLAKEPPKGAPKQGEEKPEVEQIHQKWRSLSGEPQTDALFDKEIVQRMGRAFYEQVFEPAIAEAFRRGESYQAIRDSIRKDWKPY